MNEQKIIIYNIKEKGENPRFYGQMKLFSYDPAVQSLGDSSHMAARSSSENIEKNKCNAHLKQNFFFFLFFFLLFQEMKWPFIARVTSTTKHLNSKHLARAF
jgi:restriction endonuclease S subunit